MLSSLDAFGTSATLPAAEGPSSATSSVIPPALTETEDTGAVGVLERRASGRLGLKASTVALGALPLALKDSCEMLDVAEDRFDGCPRAKSCRAAAAASAAKSVDSCSFRAAIILSSDTLLPPDIDGLLTEVAMIGYPCLCPFSRYADSYIPIFTPKIVSSSMVIYCSS